MVTNELERAVFYVTMLQCEYGELVERRKTEITRRQTCPSAVLTTNNATLTDLGPESAKVMFLFQASLV